MRPSRFLLAGTLAVAVLAAWLAGCNSADLPSVPSVDDIKNKVTGGVEAVKQTVDVAGNIELQLDKPLRTSGCYAAPLLQAAPRPNVLQVTSYDDPAAESFPSVFLRAKVQQQTPESLSGQKVPAQIFVQHDPQGPVWQSPDDAAAQLTIAKADAQSFSGQFDGVLVNLESGEHQQVSGKLSGSFAPAK